MLALPLGNEDPPKVYSSLSFVPELRKKVEPAGKYFEELVKNRVCLEENYFDEFINPNTHKNLTIEEDNEIYFWEKQYYDNLNKSKSNVFNSIKDNYYSVLGLDEQFMGATIEDIRRAYKKKVLQYHPDKAKAFLKDEKEEKEETSQIEEEKKLENEGSSRQLTEEEKAKIEVNKAWLKIKDAYDTLIDPEKKKKYDSTFEFDDTIPEEDEQVSSEDFFLVFGPSFLKNSIWSKHKPVPKLGDFKTSIDKVHKFYQFWFDFESWRDFSVEGEYNLEGKVNLK